MRARHRPCPRSYASGGAGSDRNAQICPLKIWLSNTWRHLMHERGAIVLGRARSASIPQAPYVYAAPARMPQRVWRYCCAPRSCVKVAACMLAAAWRGTRRLTQPRAVFWAHLEDDARDCRAGLLGLELLAAPCGGRACGFQPVGERGVTRGQRKVKAPRGRGASGGAVHHLRGEGDGPRKRDDIQRDVGSKHSAWHAWAPLRGARVCACFARGGRAARRTMAVTPSC